MPLFGKRADQGSRYTHMGVVRKLQDPFLGGGCILAFDQNRCLYYYQLNLKGKNDSLKQFTQDKCIAMEVYSQQGHSIIELMPTGNNGDVYALTNLRKLMVYRKN